MVQVQDIPLEAVALVQVQVEDKPLVVEAESLEAVDEELVVAKEAEV